MTASLPSCRLGLNTAAFSTVSGLVQHQSRPFGSGLVLLPGARAVADGTFSVGNFALFVVYLDQLVWNPAEIARVISDLTEAELWRRLFTRSGEVTCLVVSHRPAALRRADQVLVMEAGRIVARGT